MPIQVEFEGQVYEFPDGTTEAEIQQALGGEQHAKPPMGGLMPTAGALGGSLIGGVMGGPLGAIAGAGLGGSLGKAGEQLSTGEPSLREIGTEGLRQAGYQAAGGVAGKGIGLLGKGLYRGGVALLPRTLKDAHPNIASTGMEEGIALTRRGAQKADAMVGQSAAKADSMIAQAEAAGARPIPAHEVTKELAPVSEKMKAQAQLGKPDQRGDLVNRAGEFAQQHPKGIPLTRAQDLKREAQDLAIQAYRARDKGAVINNMEALTDESMAKGFRKAIELRVPDVVPVNQHTQNLIGLREGAEHAAGTGHILSRLGASGLGGSMASVGGVVPAIGAATAGLALGTPGGLTRTGLLLDRAIAPMASHAPDAARAAMLLELLQGESK